MNIFKRYMTPLLVSAGLLAMATLAGCGGGGDQGREPILGLPAATLSSLAVTPATATVAIGAGQQFTAIATYTDGSSQDVSAKAAWTSATPASATVNAATGVAAGKAAGSSTIAATFGGKSATAQLTVTPATLTAIVLTPLTPSIAIGGTQQFAVTGSFSDGATRDVTAVSAFAATSPATASIAAGGLALGKVAGTTQITATTGTLTASTLLTVTPAVLLSIAVTPQNPIVPVAATRQLTVIATYSDGTTPDVSASSSYSAATPAAATIGSTGLVTGVASGTSVMTASFGGKSAGTTVTVPAATMTGIAVTPATASIAVGATQQFIATATYSDNSTANITASALWTTAAPATATVLDTGIATGITAGTASISASAGVLSGSAILSVTAVVVPPPVVLVSIAVAPQAPTVLIAATRQLAVIATYSDGSTADVTAGSTFVSATPVSASVASGGLVTGVSAGSSVMSASFNGMNASTTVTVPAATLVSIAVTPATASIAVGGVQQFVATATYSDNSNAIITNSASWTSGTVATATVLNTGIATGLTAGTSTISATSAGQSGSALLTVTSVAVPPVINPINLGRAATFGVLAGTSITNNSGGTTLVTGDVGAPSQTVDPTQAAGYTNYKSGAILAGAMTDLQAAITDGNSRSCDVTFAGGIDLGGQTFGPGVYCYAGAISITGTLTLNGPGVYIFRTALTLNSTVNSVVALNNGATADNVTWLPVGPTTLAANSVFKGNILGQSAAITVGDNTTLLNGRVLTAAAVTLRNNQITK
nr:Ig-like domain-containing protein [uncultured Janthinobacterium sp.]